MHIKIKNVSTAAHTRALIARRRTTQTNTSFYFTTYSKREKISLVGSDFSYKDIYKIEYLIL